MRIYYKTAIYDNCLTPCPMADVVPENKGVMVGSCACQKCKHCMGMSNVEFSPFALFHDANGIKMRESEWVLCGAKQYQNRSKLYLWMVKHVMAPLSAWLEMKMRL